MARLFKRAEPLNSFKPVGFWHSGSVVSQINEATLHRTRLVYTVMGDRLWTHSQSWYM